MKSPQKILIVRTDRIGDVILTLPLAKIIKKKYPFSEVVFMVRKYTAPLVDGHKYIDDVILYDEKEKLSDSLKKLKSFNFDFSIVVHPSFKIAFLIFLAKIKARIGTGYRWYSFLFNKKLYEHRKYGKKHELEHNLELLRFLGIPKVVDQEIEFNIPVDEESREKAKTVLEEFRIEKSNPLIIIHPGSGGSAIDLPLQSFKELIAYLHELDVEVALTGSENERKICEEISTDKTKNLAGLFNLKELTAFINESDIFIANSTGPLHIAAALNKFVVGFYPKFPAASPVRWGPYTTKKLILTPEIDCEPCTRKQCEELNCMKSISPKKVFDKLRKVLYSDFSPER